MGVELLTERHKDQIAGVLGCWDRVLIFGTLPKICYAGGMTSYLYERQIRIFDYPKFAEPFRERLRENAEGLAKGAGIALPYDRWWFLITFLLFTFACAVGTHRWIELPAKRGLRALAR